jgi:hypothetical protein
MSALRMCNVQCHLQSEIRRTAFYAVCTTRRHVSSWIWFQLVCTDAVQLPFPPTFPFNELSAENYKLTELTWFLVVAAGRCKFRLGCYTKFCLEDLWR